MPSRATAERTTYVELEGYIQYSDIYKDAFGNASKLLLVHDNDLAISR